MKFLLTGDLHLHNHKKSVERLEDCLNALNWIFEVAKEKQVDGIIVLGDLFHDRQKISIPVYHKTFEVFKKHLEGNNLKVYLLLGNHDLWYQNRWDISSVFPLQAFNNVKVVDEPCTLNLDGFPVSFLPYTTNPLESLKLIKNKNNIRVLCGHIAVDGALLNAAHGIRAEVTVEHDGSMVKVDADMFREWNFVFLGHYHAAQKLDFNIEYIGSPLQLSFGEAFQEKYLLIFDTETLEKEYVLNTFSPKHLIIPESKINKFNLKNNFVKIVVDNVSATNIVEMRNRLVNEHQISSFEIIENLKTQEHKQVIDDVKAILQDRSKMLENFIEQMKKNPGFDLQDGKIMEIWNKITDQAENN